MPTMRSEPMPQDEISLLDLWAIVVRRKHWIIGSVVMCVLVAAAYLWVAKPVYEASAKIRIGQVAAGGSFEAPEVVAAKLLSRFGQKIADGVRRERPYLKSVTVPKGLPSVVEIVSEGDAPEQAVKILNTAFSAVHESHEPVYAQNIQALDERIARVDTQRTSLASQMNEAEELVRRLKQQDPVQASLVLIESGNLASAITELDAERPLLTQKRTAPQTQATELLGPIEPPAEPARPKKNLVLTIAVVLGLVGGFLLAFAVDLLRSKSASQA